MPKDRDPLRIPARDARRLAILGQRLAGKRPRPTPSGVLEVIRDIGYLQLDPTNVVARNPLQVLFSRLGPYDPKILDDLLTKRRELFETVSLILPTSDLAIHAAAVRAYRRATSPRAAAAPHGVLAGGGGGTWPTRAGRFLAANQALRRYVLGRLRREGPLPLTAFEDRSIESWTSGGWNDERNVTMMLAVLQRRGEVVVAGRRRGHKVWGIGAGWLPKPEAISALEVERRATERAIRSLGVATVKQIGRHYAFSRPRATPRALTSLLREGRIVPVQVEELGDARTVFYAVGGIERRLREVRDGWEGRTTLLSPFDSLIIDRDRALMLFDFYYRMEIYVPPRLRKRGYWAMPILHDDRIIGTLDPRVDRETRRLIVDRIVTEPGAPAGRRVGRAVRSAVEELAEFTGAEAVVWPRKMPAAWGGRA